MEKKEIIKSISDRTNKEIYLGVVGAVRTGKSTFIKKFIESLVLPNIDDENERKRCIDEIPQSASGKNIMTIEPKFVPSNAATIKVDDFTTNIRLVDSVGYVIDGCKGYEDENGPRMVKTPWYDDAIPFREAAEIGTEKVIRDHSTIGIVITTDGSITDIERSSYVSKEEQVIMELKEIGKPFIIILNSSHPTLPETERLAYTIKEKYNVPTLPMNIELMGEKESLTILKEALYEFKIEEVDFNIPEWIASLNKEHWLKQVYINKIKECIVDVDKLRDIDKISKHLTSNEYIEKSYISNVDSSNGNVIINLEAPNNLYNTIINEIIGSNISSKGDLINLLLSLKETENEYDNIKSAIKQVKQTGYGVAIPNVESLKLDEPEILKHGNRYGVKLKAVAPSICMIRVDVESTFEPIIGSESQSKELVDYLLRDKDNKSTIWNSEIFGRSLNNIIEEGIRTKVAMIPENIQLKLQSTMTKVVNKGSNNMIAIVI